MLFRAIALSLALLVGMTTVIPFLSNSAEAIHKKSDKKKKKLKKYSKAWWRWYRKEQRRKRVLLAKKRALRARQILLARKGTQKAKPISTSKDSKTSIEKVANNSQLEKKSATKNVKINQPTESELQFRVKDEKGNALGTASLSIFGLAKDADSKNSLNKIGGVPTSLLRRDVVDKMVKEDGWVVNDFNKTVDGKQVYVVIAQSSLKGVVQSRLFYFTEVGGKIFSLSTTCPKEAQERIAQESEKVLESLQRGNTLSRAGIR